MTAASEASAVEDFRRQCEARHWLAKGFGQPGLIDELMVRITAKRGRAAAEELREEMREQWRLKHQAGAGA